MVPSCSKALAVWQSSPGSTSNQRASPPPRGTTPMRAGWDALHSNGIPVPQSRTIRAGESKKTAYRSVRAKSWR
ncbi:MAG: hypothetical protein QM820_42510 [Minicystis sp.]